MRFCYGNIWQRDFGSRPQQDTGFDLRFRALCPRIVSEILTILIEVTSAFGKMCLKMIALSQRMTKCCNLQSKDSLDSELIDVKASLCRPLTAVQLCELLNGGHAVSLLGESIANWSFVALQHSIMDYLLLLHCATFASNSSIYFRPNCLEKKPFYLLPLQNSNGTIG